MVASSTPIREPSLRSVAILLTASARLRTLCPSLDVASADRTNAHLGGCEAGTTRATMSLHDPSDSRDRRRESGRDPGMRADGRATGRRPSAMRAERKEAHLMSEHQSHRLIDEAIRLRLSRRGIIKRAAVIGLSATAANAVLTATGKAAAPNLAPALLQTRSLNVLASSYFVPDGQAFYQKQIAEWGQQNGVTMSADFVNWPDLQPKIAAAVEG